MAFLMRVVCSLTVAFLLMTGIPLVTEEAEAATETVSVANFRFSPSTATIDTGDAIQWRWDGGTHSVVQEDGTTWCSTRSSGTCSKTFDTAGTYDYYCSVHPSSMRATIIVEDDIDPPSLTIDTPTADSTVQGTIDVSGSADSTEDTVATVETRIDDGAWAPADGTTSWSTTLDTAPYSNGTHTLSARATDSAGRSTTTSITLTFENPPPVLTITSPSDGDAVEGVFQVEGDATSDEGIDRVEVRFDSGAWETATGTMAWSHEIDVSEGIVNGPYPLDVRATDIHGRSTIQTIAVVVDNPEHIDLDLVSFSARNTLTGSMAMSATVDNPGNIHIGSEIRFEYRYQGEWHTIETVPLDVDAFSAVTIDIRWDDDYKVGRFDLRATVDPTDTIAEHDETNNQAETRGSFYTDLVKGRDIRDTP